MTAKRVRERREGGREIKVTGNREGEREGGREIEGGKGERK